MKKSGSVTVQGHALQYQWGKNRLTVTSRIGDHFEFLLNDNGQKQDLSRDLAYDVVNSAIEQGVLSEELESIRPDMIFEVFGHSAKGKLFAKRYTQ